MENLDQAFDDLGKVLIHSTKMSHTTVVVTAAAILEHDLERCIKTKMRPLKKDMENKGLWPDQLVCRKDRLGLCARNVMHFSAGEVIAEERRDLGTAKSLKAAKTIAMSDWEKRSVISTDPLPVMKPTVLEWKSVTPDLDFEIAAGSRRPRL